MCFLVIELDLKIQQAMQNTFVGRDAGVKFDTGGHNVIVGSQDTVALIGSPSTQTQDDITFVGSQAGAINREDENTFVGFQAGFKNSTGMENTFVGHTSGRKNTTGSHNSFLGYKAGDSNTQGHRNTFIGNYAGEKNKRASDNIFIGFQAGQENTSGRKNVGIGALAGNENSAGDNNVFLGYKAGSKNKNGDNNVFIGVESGPASGNSYRSVFIGRQAGANLSSGASNSVYIGAGVEGATGSNEFVLGNMITPSWMSGDITSTGQLRINGILVNTTTPGSSRVLKKDIVLFDSYEERLKDIIETPLYTYKYVGKNDFPRKTRMGIISEDLPDHLQLKRKNKLSFPDWPSIYGTFWASLKVLYKMAVEMKKTFEQLQSEFQDILSQILQIQDHFKLFKEQIFSHRDHELQNFNRTVEEIKENVSSSRRHQNQLLNHSSEELSQMKEQLQRMNSSLELFEEQQGTL